MLRQNIMAGSTKAEKKLLTSWWMGCGEKVGHVRDMI
jgi:hypothetical protein